MMKKIKSIIFTLIISVGILGLMHFIPIKINKQKSEQPMVEEAISLVEDVNEEVIEIPETVEVPEIIVEEYKEEPKKEPVIEEPVKEEVKPVEPEKKEIESTPKKEENKKVEENNKSKKAEDKKNTEVKKEDKKPSEKESKIGVDRKLVSGIPGTLNYKGKFPSHNVKEKGSITITYTVDKEGNVISAYRSAGLRDKNTINNAVTLVRRHVKAEKGKTNSVGTYTIEFK